MPRSVLTISAWFPLVLTCGLLAALPAMAETQPPETRPPDSTAEARETDDPQAASSCSDMVAKDDGSLESGYGFVPSAKVGTYVQAFDRSELRGKYLTSVCLCFLKTRGDVDVEFDVVVYRDQGGRPGRRPIVRVAGSQKGVASSKEEAGAFVEVEMPWVKLPEGTVYIGAEWDPSEEQFLFICNDQSNAQPKTPAFFSEDPKAIWTSVFTAKDPIFRPHRALLVRAQASNQPPPELKQPDASASPSVQFP